ncbi:MAG: xanthine dehydrogenase family protein molybdopterin-binding subunit [Aestuariivita sp.]|nr:xanthine dehydrogenase family protein molybdopterin-binding subunit [Aestuariivita sp.]
MEKFGKSQSVKRIEDYRFLTGRGNYVDHTAPQHALYAYFLRSQVAHGNILELNLDDARQADGVHLAVSVADLESAGMNISIDATVVKNRDGTPGASPMRPVLAKERVRYVGEPIAMIVAETLDQARDAAELAVWDIDERPAKIDVEPGGEVIFPATPDNCAFNWVLGNEEAVESVFQAAHKTVSLKVKNNRIVVNSMEPRGCWANMEGERLHLCFSGQGVWDMKDSLSKAFCIDADMVRVTTPDVGGGFGMKAMAYSEYFCVAYAATKLKNPVRWMCERSEAMLSDNGGRDLVSLAELAFDETNKITGYRVKTRCNLGAYNSQFGQPIQTQLFSRVLMGVYDVQTTLLDVEGYYTNTVQVDAYRGAGRPEAIYVLERAIDFAAKELGVDPWDLRRRNFIKPAKFPYKSATGEIYDVGDFDRVLNRVTEVADASGFARRKSRDLANGFLRGQGLCYYIESILGDPSENAKVVFSEDGTLAVYVGTQSNGQGHETVFSQFLSDQTGIPVNKIKIIQGDSDQIERGGGTGGSRSVTVQNNALLATVEKMVTVFKSFLAEKMGVSEDDVIFDDETFRAASSNLTPNFLEAAEMARADGRTDLLSFQARAKLEGRSFPNGAHVAEVVIDPETGCVMVDCYTVVDDFGNLINPLLVEGQVHGGVVQGIGQALTEHVVYDQDGQLLSASLMDYALPRADHLPMIKFFSEPVPSTANVMGMKGCGEAGTVGALAAVANAVQDALWDQGVRQSDMPFTPQRIWEYLNARN